MDTEWRGELDEWLAPFVAALRHKTRGRMCPAYIAGLIGPGDRKSIQPMAARDGVSYDRLHHFIASGLWDEEPLEAALLAEADRQVGGEKAWLIIDDTGAAQEGAPFRWRGAAICLGAGQERQLPDAGVSDAGIWRSPHHGRAAPVPARELDRRHGPPGADWSSSRLPSLQDEARDRAGGDRQGPRRGVSASAVFWLMRAMVCRHHSGRA